MKGRNIAFAVVGGVIGIGIAAYGGVWLLGERIVGKTYDIEPETIAIPEGPEALAEGERFADITGCTGCHNADLNGEFWGEAPFIYRFSTANLARLAKSYSDEDFEIAIRHGVKKNGRSVLAMPSPSFYDMRNEDLGKIIAFIRSKPDEGENLPASEIRVLGRLEMLNGRHPPEASTIDHDRPRREFDLSDPVQHGEYLALMACSECHGLDFKGPPDEEPGPGIPPDLVVASAYSLEDFSKLMRTGFPPDGRELGLMGEVARVRLVHFTDEEISAVHQFLIHRAQTMND